MKAIETPEFDQYKEVEFYRLIKGEAEEKDIGHSGGGGGFEAESLAVQSHL